MLWRDDDMSVQPPGDATQMPNFSDLNRPLMTIAALFGAAGVVLAAKGTHGSELDTAIAGAFLIRHARTLLLIATLKARRLTQIAGYVLVVALVLFCGDLAMRDGIHFPRFPFLAPLGGAGLILGWVVLAVSAWVR
jgi:uncharacterized membrane protein YgdD (TMEM256/DUF423 family)